VYLAHSRVIFCCKMDVVYIGKCTVNLQVNICVPSLCEMPSVFFLSVAMELIEDTLMSYV
jgi:hypothetical protein